jgi:hypothetical protein
MGSIDAPADEIAVKHLPTWIWVAAAAFACGALLASLF